MSLRDAAQMALEALEYGQHSLKQVSEYQWESRGQLAMQALRAALATENIIQDRDLLKETQEALRAAWAIIKKLRAVQDAARELIESDPESAADAEGEAFTAWCVLVAAIDDADTLLCEFGESK